MLAHDSRPNRDLDWEEWIIPEDLSDVQAGSPKLVITARAANASGNGLLIGHSRFLAFLSRSQRTLLGSIEHPAALDMHDPHDAWILRRSGKSR